jgi:glycolate oxidase iron-sulfur subunit
MRHNLDSRSLGPRTEQIKHAVETCVHCGFCLPTCPTYDVLGLEGDSPRGRIVLMKSVLEGTLSAETAAPHIDRCLGCLSCETSCPSGVPYGELLSSYRVETAPQTPRPFSQRLQTFIASATLPYPKLLRPLMILGRFAKKLGKLNPKPLRPMLELVPDALPNQEPLLERYEAIGKPRGAVAIHLGCVQRVMRPETSAATVRVLTRNGYNVRVLRQPSCCGALDWHVGNVGPAQKFAKKLCRELSDDVSLVTTAAGCGSAVKEYPLVLADADDRTRQLAKRVAAASLDVTELLDRNELVPVPDPGPLRIAYHDACHLAHAQSVRSAPRSLLKQIPNVTLLEIQDGHFCCGSAGLYNIQQPELASELGRRKAQKILEQKPDVVALGNIGCQVQIVRHLNELGSDIPVLHTLEILDRAYRGVSIASDGTSGEMRNDLN